MMDKLASDAYSQGAVDALQSMNIPHHVKVATAQYMTKEALQLSPGLRDAGSRLKEIFQRGGAKARASRLTQGPMPTANKMSLLPSEAAVADAAKQLRNDRIIAGVLGAGGLTAGGLGVADAMGAFDEEEVLPQDLMSRIRRGELNKELALGGAGLAALGGGAAYALS